MALTKDERERRAGERKEQKRRRDEKQKRLKEQFPPAMLSSNHKDHEFFQIRIEEGYDRWLKIRYKGTSWWGDDFIGAARHPDIQCANIGLDPEQLGSFIRALIIRYNAMVKEMNEVVADTPPLLLATRDQST